VTPLGTFNCPAHRGVGKARIGSSQVWSDAAKGGQATKALLDGFDASEQCREVTCLYHGTNWWLEDLIDSSVDPASLDPVPDRGDFFL
jgi:hypothetical protein